ncbi:MAG: AEC family transporter [Butyrivibrio sp.]|nr:AEC family transporter [Butyrivibrio sp.]
MESFIIATNAVMPFMVYIAIGMLARKAGWVREEFLREFNGILFKVFFPFIMFNNLYDVDFSTLKNANYVIFATIGTIVLITLALIIVPFFEKDNRRKGVIVQAVYRSNSVLFALPLAVNVLGEAASVKASIAIAFLVPLYNIAAVAILEYYRGGKVSGGVIIKNILKNPLIMGAVAGFIFNMLPITMPACFVSPLTQLANLATPMALFVLGGTLHFSDLRKNLVTIVIGTVLKLIVVPAVMITIMAAMNFDTTEFFIVFCLYATPVAAATFPMAHSMGADADLAGEYVVVTTLCSIFTIFTWIIVLRNFGLL